MQYITPEKLLEEMKEQGEKILYAVVTEKKRMQKLINSLTDTTRAEIAPQFYEMIGKLTGSEKTFYYLYWTAKKSVLPENIYVVNRETQIVETHEVLKADKIREEKESIYKIQAETRDIRIAADETITWQYKNKIPDNVLKYYALVNLNYTEQEGEENIKKVNREMERIDRLYNIDLNKTEKKMSHPVQILRLKYLTDIAQESEKKIKNNTERFIRMESLAEATEQVDNSLNILKSGEIDYDELKELQIKNIPKPPPVPKKEPAGLLAVALEVDKLPPAKPKQAKKPVGDVVEEEKAQEEGDRGPPEEGEGEGIFYNVYQMATKGKRQRLPPPIRKFINQYGDRQIIYMKVCKKPISNFYDAAINITSFGKWSANKKAMNYDKMAHLYIVFSFGDSVYYRLEKNHVIEISIYSRDYDETCEIVDMENNSVTFSELINNAYERYGFNYLYYDAIKANCQIFVSQTLDASNLLTTELKNYIMQDVEQVLTPYVNKIMSPFVNLAYRLDTLRRGDGAGSFR